MGQIVRMRRYIGNRKVEYIKPVKKDADDNRNVQLLLKMYNHEGEHFYRSTTVTKEVSLKDVITHVLFLQDNELVKLSLIDVEYLDSYFSSASTSMTAASDDDGRRVQLVLSRSGRLRRAVTFSS